MELFVAMSSVAVWIVLLALAFMLLGALRAMGVLSWRIEELEAKTPSRLGRDGLKPGRNAPDFTLPAVVGGEVALHDFVGRKVLLVLVQGGCSPCHLVVPELNKLQRNGDLAVLAVFHGPVEVALKWSTDVRADFPVLAQDQLAVSKRYQVFATPFAFLIDEQGVIRSKGIVNNRQHVGYVLAGRGAGSHSDEHGVEPVLSKLSHATTSTQEISHV
jgi:methylamine dehydrogenase accessory protein MauD